MAEGREAGKKETLNTLFDLGKGSIDDGGNIHPETIVCGTDKKDHYVRSVSAGIPSEADAYDAAISAREQGVTLTDIFFMASGEAHMLSKSARSLLEDGINEDKVKEIAADPANVTEKLMSLFIVHVDVDTQTIEVHVTYKKDGKWTRRKRGKGDDTSFFPPELTGFTQAVKKFKEGETGLKAFAAFMRGASS